MKKEMRKKLLEIRNNMTEEEVERKSKAICETLKKVLPQDEFKTVMVYIPADNEVDISPFIQSLFENNVRVVAPICKTQGIMQPAIIENLDTDLTMGCFNILAPKEERFVKDDEIDAVIVPGVGFDRQGNRLGFGAGYYDRFLPRMRQETRKIAICYEDQILDEFKAESWDFPADTVVTEDNIYACDGCDYKKGS